MDNQMQDTCPDDALMQAVTLAGNDEKAAIARIRALLDAHPADPRLHFLEGSLLAAMERYEEGRAAMSRAVALAPDYEVARFQLGLLELSSGDGAAADQTLAPLADADPELGLSLFARGLRHLVKDEMDAAADCLRRGLVRNREHPLINRDMELMIAGIDEARAAAGAAPAASEDVSATHLLLQQYADKNTKH
jgi:tetratricopeptide (TPR) repeat protein